MDILFELNKTEQAVVRYFELDESELYKSYDHGKWTVKQILHHITDAESVLLERIKRGISKPGQTVNGFDQDAWCEALGYHDMPLKISLEQFLSARKGIYYLAQKFYKSHGHNSYTHNETGERSVKEEFDKVVWHCRHHLDQIKMALDSTL